MKLQAKARPVQINKLKLGGKEINTKEDLLQNFYLNEIVNLGNKFTQWIRRNSEMRVYSEQIDTIFKVRNKERVAHDLLYLFFPIYNGKTLLNVLYDWYDNKKNINLPKSLLYCMNSSESLAVELIERYSNDKPFIADWIEDCSEKIFLSSEFCYRLGIFFKNFNDSKSKYWLNKAADSGSIEAILELRKNNNSDIEINDNFNIEIKDKTLKLIRIKSSDGDFYITKSALPNNIFKSLGITNITREDYQCRSNCDLLLEKLSNYTKLIWRYPTLEQWELANKTKMLEPTLKHKGEWCKDKHPKIDNVYGVANYASKWLFSDKENYLRPILIVKENPKLS